MRKMLPVALPRPQSVSRRLRLAIVTWLAILGLDFLLNGAVFARMYQGGGPFMLSPTEAFRRIPLREQPRLVPGLVSVRQPLPTRLARPMIAACCTGISPRRWPRPRATW